MPSWRTTTLVEDIHKGKVPAAQYPEKEETIIQQQKSSKETQDDSAAQDKVEVITNSDTRQKPWKQPKTGRRKLYQDPSLEPNTCTIKSDTRKFYLIKANTGCYKSSTYKISTHTGSSNDDCANRCLNNNQCFNFYLSKDGTN